MACGVDAIIRDATPGLAFTERIPQVPCVIASSPKSSLVLYAKCKAIDRGMVMTDVKVLQKHGGKSGSWVVGDGVAVDPPTLQISRRYTP